MIIIIAACIPSVAADVFIVNVVKNELINARMETLQNQNGILKNYIVNDNYIDTLDSQGVTAQINQMASANNGRIEIINKDLEIIKDTYVNDEGKINIAESVIKALNGNSVSYYDRKTGKIIYAIPIIDTKHNQETDTAVKGVLYAVYSTASVETMVDKYISYAVMFEVIIILLALGVSIFISSVLVRPFKNIETSISKIGNGNYNEKILMDDYIETQKIGEAFNAMTSRIEKLEQSRQEFVSNVSHELKTPITSIKVLADSLLMQEDIPVEMYREFLSDIVDEIDRENKIITDLLELVKLDKNNTELNIASVNINDLMEIILKRLKPIAQQKNIELVFESFRPVVADVDEVKFTSAISNLVENAIKYNVLDGWVRVSVNADHKYFYIKVSDGGIGIPEEDQEHVFDRFFRVGKARDRQTGGTGLGLAICKSSILLHRGAVKLHSKEGQGTTFTVRVPLKYIP
ncbi:MAG: sensor histidine kinase [Eubacterium sp.]